MAPRALCFQLFIHLPAAVLLVLLSGWPRAAAGARRVCALRSLGCKQPSSGEPAPEQGTAARTLPSLPLQLSSPRTASRGKWGFSRGMKRLAMTGDY